MGGLPELTHPNPRECQMWAGSSMARTGPWQPWLTPFPVSPRIRERAAPCCPGEGWGRSWAAASFLEEGVLAGSLLSRSRIALQRPQVQSQSEEGLVPTVPIRS